MTKLHVTDHAVLRYIERIHGVDVETLREELRQMAVRGAQAAETIGGGEYAIKTGEMTLKVVGCNVVTIVAPRKARDPRAVAPAQSERQT